MMSEALVIKSDRQKGDASQSTWPPSPAATHPHLPPPYAAACRVLGIKPNRTTVQAALGGSDAPSIMGWVRHVDFSGTYIGPKQALAVAMLLAQGWLPNVEFLSVAGNAVSDEFFKALASPLMGPASGPPTHPFPALRKLDVSRNLLSIVSSEALLAIAQRSPNLAVVDRESCEAPHDLDLALQLQLDLNQDSVLELASRGNAMTRGRSANLVRSRLESSLMHADTLDASSSPSVERRKGAEKGSRASGGFPPSPGNRPPAVVGSLQAPPSLLDYNPLQVLNPKDRLVPNLAWRQAGGDWSTNVDDVEWTQAFIDARLRSLDDDDDDDAAAKQHRELIPGRAPQGSRDESKRQVEGDGDQGTTPEGTSGRSEVFVSAPPSPATLNTPWWDTQGTNASDRDNRRRDFESCVQRLLDGDVEAATGGGDFLAPSLKFIDQDFPPDMRSLTGQEAARRDDRPPTSVVMPAMRYPGWLDPASIRGGQQVLALQRLGGAVDIAGAHIAGAPSGVVPIPPPRRQLNAAAMGATTFAVKWKRLFELPQITAPRFHSRLSRPLASLAPSAAADVINGFIQPSRVCGSRWLLNGLWAAAVSGVSPFFVSRYYPELGIVEVTLTVGGSDAIKVVLDDYVPVASAAWRSDDGARREEGPTEDEEDVLLCAHGSDPNDVWIPLFEKAYAKLSGGYHRLSCGSTATSLSDCFLGARVRRFHWSLSAIAKNVADGSFYTELSRMFARERIKAAAGGHYASSVGTSALMAVIAASESSLQRQGLLAAGIAPNEAYLLDRLVSIVPFDLWQQPQETKQSNDRSSSSSQARSFCLVRLRQPNPLVTWQGRFSPTSSELFDLPVAGRPDATAPSPLVAYYRRVLGWQPAEQRGMFQWMLLEDFVAFFNRMYFVTDVPAVAVRTMAAAAAVTASPQSATVGSHQMGNVVVVVDTTLAQSPSPLDPRLQASTSMSPASYSPVMDADDRFMASLKSTVAAAHATGGGRDGGASPSSSLARASPSSPQTQRLADLDENGAATATEAAFQDHPVMGVNHLFQKRYIGVVATSDDERLAKPSRGTAETLPSWSSSTTGGRSWLFPSCMWTCNPTYYVQVASKNTEVSLLVQQPDRRIVAGSTGLPTAGMEYLTGLCLYVLRRGPDSHHGGVTSTATTTSVFSSSSSLPSSVRRLPQAGGYMSWPTQRERQWDFTTDLVAHVALEHARDVSCSFVAQPGTLYVCIVAAASSAGWPSSRGVGIDPRNPATLLREKRSIRRQRWSPFSLCVSAYGRVTSREAYPEDGVCIARRQSAWRAPCNLSGALFSVWGTSTMTRHVLLPSSTKDGDRSQRDVAGRQQQFTPLFVAPYLSGMGAMLLVPQRRSSAAIDRLLSTIPPSEFQPPQFRVSLTTSVNGLANTRRHPVALTVVVTREHTSPANPVVTDATAASWTTSSSHQQQQEPTTTTKKATHTIRREGDDNGRDTVPPTSASLSAPPPRSHSFSPKPRAFAVTLLRGATPCFTRPDLESRVLCHVGYAEQPQLVLQYDLTEGGDDDPSRDQRTSPITESQRHFVVLVSTVEPHGADDVEQFEVAVFSTCAVQTQQVYPF